MTVEHHYSILGTGSYLPDEIVGNDALEMRLGLPAGWIEERTGIRCRHRAAAPEATSDLAAAAARRALASAGVEPRQLSLIVLGTATPDELGPASACRVQALIGAHRAVAYDISAACTGFLFGLKMALGHLREEPYGQGYALVIGAEVWSRFLDPVDRGTAVLFGDGAAAAVIGPVPAPYGIGRIHLGSDGYHAGDVLIPAGGGRLPATTATVAAREHTIRMDSKAVRDFIADVFPRLVAEAVAEEGVSTESVRLVVSHQPNPWLLADLTEPAGLTHRQVVIASRETGNIGAGCLPYTLDRALRDTPPGRGDLVLLTGFGAGLTWGRAMVRWHGAVLS